MQRVNVGIVGLGNVGMGTIAVLTENAEQISLKLGFDLKIKAVCSPTVHSKQLPAPLKNCLKTTDWREVVASPDVDIVAELIGGTTVARDVIVGAIKERKSIVTANKELIALAGGELWDRAIKAGINLAMEASVAGGIPIHAVLREGISGDRINTLYGILNGTSNFILTEIEKRRAAFEDVLAEAQKLGYAEADPSADIDGYDARSKLAILSALAFGERITPSDIYTEGIRRIQPIDFQYAHRLSHTIRLLCTARQTEEGLTLVRASGADPDVDHSRECAGRLQRHLGEGRVRCGYVLLWARRGSASHRGRSGERPDARRPGDPVGQPRARVALRASAARRMEADPDYDAEAPVLSPLPREGPAGDHRVAGVDSGRAAHQPGCRAAVAVR